MTRTERRQHLETLLALLGSSVGEIVSSLSARGITGRRGSVCACPLANYLRGHTGAAVFVHGSFVLAPYEGDQGVPLTLGLTARHEALCAFLVQFDYGHWPELEQKRERAQ